VNSELQSEIKSLLAGPKKKKEANRCGELLTMFEFEVLDTEPAGGGWFVSLACQHQVWSAVEVTLQKWPCTTCGLGWLQQAVPQQPSGGIRLRTRDLIKPPYQVELNIQVAPVYRSGGPVVCWDWDCVSEHVGNHVLWSDAASLLLGCNEFVDRGIEWWLEHVHPDERVRVMQGVHAALAGRGRHWSDMYLFRRVDGYYAIVLDEAQITRNKSGTAVRMLGQMHELVQRRH